MSSYGRTLSNVDEPRPQRDCCSSATPLATEMCVECAFQFRWTNAACIVQRCGGAECDDFENVAGRSGQDITEATDTNVESGTVYRYRVYALKPTPQARGELASPTW